MDTTKITLVAPAIMPAFKCGDTATLVHPNWPDGQAFTVTGVELSHDQSRKSFTLVETREWKLRHLVPPLIEVRIGEKRLISEAGQTAGEFLELVARVVLGESEVRVSGDALSEIGSPAAAQQDAEGVWVTQDG